MAGAKSSCNVDVLDSWQIFAFPLRASCANLPANQPRKQKLTEAQKKILEQKLWDSANTLRGKMNADEFRDYILGFIFFKYLSERMHRFANDVLKQDGIDYITVNETTEDGQAILDAISEASVDALGYFLRPSELFSQMAKRGSKPGQFILADLTKILNSIQRSTMGTESEDDFDNLFEDLDLTSSKLGRTEDAKNALISYLVFSSSVIFIFSIMCETDIPLGILCV
jgi:type I restriction enzyme M protein